MTNTLRVLSALQSLMPVATVNGISAQDINDLLYSVLGVVPYAAKTSAYTLTDDDVFVTADATGGAFNVTVPAGSTMRAGKLFIVMRINGASNAVGIARTGSDTFNGATSKSLASQYAGIVLLGTGTAAWWAFALTGA